jgi:tetrapyrrole methylase family protein/MazG family protein
VAAEAKLTLMGQYPEDHPVLLIHGAGSPEQRVESLPLWQIDRSQAIGAMSALLVPPLGEPSSFESLQEVIAHLRAPDGCPWDRRQTHQSLRSHLLEECYEALEAIDREDMEALRAELGDLLLQIVLQAQIAAEEGEFSMPQVIAGIRAKLVRRHPHVFGDLDVEEVDQVLRNWEQLKAEEREEAGDENGVLGGVPGGLPALAQAYELQARAARVGFDWPSIDGVLAKVHEELEEVQEAPDAGRQAGELGDLLFAVVNYARWLEVDPEAALRAANRRFRERFAAMERQAKASGRPLNELGIEELDALWEAAKNQGEDSPE